MQRWGSAQAPSSSVLLRTGALASLASLGTATLVVCAALAVGGPSGGTFPGALASGSPAGTVDTTERPTALAAPSGRRPTAGPDTGGRAHPAAAGRDGSSSPVGRTDGADALSGTTSSAARTPADLDSVVHPARGQVVATHPAALSPPPSLSRSALGPQRAVSAVRGAPAGPPAVPGTTPPGPASSGRSPQQSSAPTAAAVEPEQAAEPPAPAPVAGKARAVRRAVEAAVARAPQIAKAPQVAEAPKASQVAEAPPAAPAAAEPAPRAGKAVPAPAPKAEKQAGPLQHGKSGQHPKGQPPGQAKGNGPKH